MRYRSNLPMPVRLELSAFLVPREEMPALAAQLGEDFKMLIAPGEEFDAPAPLNHPQLEPIDEDARGHAAMVADQDLEHARAYHLQYGPSEGRATPEFPQIEQPPVPPAPGEPGFEDQSARRQRSSKGAQE